MKIVSGNIWDIEADWYCIPTNGVVNSIGRAVMGAGLAKQAAWMFPEIDIILGQLLSTYGNRVFSLGKREMAQPPYGEYLLMSFPTKHHWKDPSDLELIKKSCDSLRVLHETNSRHLDRSITVVMPKVGCGLGGLDWEKEVKPVVEEILSPLGDNLFVVV